MIGSIAIAADAAQDSISTMWIVLILIGAVVILIMTGVIIAFLKLWMRALVSGVPVSFGELIGMRLRKVPAGLIVEGLIMAHKAGVGDVTLEALEHHHLAGGNVIPVVRALVAAKRANMDLSFEHAAAIDLDGRDVFREVHEAARAVPSPGA